MHKRLIFCKECRQRRFTYDPIHELELRKRHFFKGKGIEWTLEEQALVFNSDFLEYYGDDVGVMSNKYATITGIDDI